MYEAGFVVSKGLLAFHSLFPFLKTKASTLESNLVLFVHFKYF